MLASLNHPNIAAASHGLEDIRLASRALVLELVEGPTLADRIASGTDSARRSVADRPTDRRCARSRARAGNHPSRSQAGERQGASDGAVKVLDFGLAKALEPVAGAAHVSQSATITSPAMTPAGHGAGHSGIHESRASEGQPAHKRGDVWAFGCVLYELLAGKRAFEGVEMSDTMAAVLRAEPNWAASPRRYLSRSPRSSNAVWRRTTNGACAISVTRGSSSMTQSAAAHRIRRRDRLGEPGALPGSQPWPFSRLS